MNELDAPLGVFADSLISAPGRRRIVKVFDDDSFPLQLLASRWGNFIRQLDSAHDGESQRPRPSDI